MYATYYVSGAAILMVGTRYPCRADLQQGSGDLVTDCLPSRLSRVQRPLVDVCKETCGGRISNNLLFVVSFVSVICLVLPPYTVLTSHRLKRVAAWVSICSRPMLRYLPKCIFFCVMPFRQFLHHLLRSLMGMLQ
jgi:hypothetical protein